MSIEKSFGMRGKVFGAWFTINGTSNYSVYLYGGTSCFLEHGEKIQEFLRMSGR